MLRDGAMISWKCSGCLPEGIPEQKLHIFGKGNAGYMGELRQKSVELGVAGRVEWHDFVPDRHDIYANLDVCVVPGRMREPFGLAALEAGLFGLPAIVTRRGGLPEIIEHEVNGLVVEAERSAEIADPLCRLIEQPSLRRRLGPMPDIERSSILDASVL
jgi:glycosyltransferase involved in cell wall biosynthesis